VYACPKSAFSLLIPDISVFKNRPRITKLSKRVVQIPGNHNIIVFAHIFFTTARTVRTAVTCMAYIFFTRFHCSAGHERHRYVQT